MKKYKGKLKFHCKYGKGMEDKSLSYLTKLIKNPEARKKVESWVEERNSNNLTLKNTRSDIYRIIQFLNYHNKPIEKITKEDNIGYFKDNQISHSVKKRLRRFLRWCNAGEYPENIKWLQIKKKVEETTEEKEPLSDDEVKGIIGNTINMRDRCMLGIMADQFPVRSIEIRQLKAKDVLHDKYGVKLKIYSKTPAGRREIRLINSLPDFKTYWKTYPFKDNPEAPLFYSFSPNGFGKSVSWNVIKSAIDNSIKRAKIKRHVTSHDFRRYVATKLLTNPNYTPMEIKRMGGWQNIAILDTYSRVTSRHVTDKAAELNGKGKKEKPKEDPLKPATCLHCGAENSPLNNYCDKCNKPISAKGFAEEEQKRNVFELAVAKKIANPERSFDEILLEINKKGEIKI